MILEVAVLDVRPGQESDFEWRLNKRLSSSRECTATWLISFAAASFPKPSRDGNGADTTKEIDDEAPTKLNLTKRGERLDES